MCIPHEFPCIFHSQIAAVACSLYGSDRLVYRNCPSCSETVKKCNTNPKWEKFTSTIKIVPFKTCRLQHWGTNSTMNAKLLLFWRNFCVVFFPGTQYVQFLIMPPLFPHLCLSMCNFRVLVTVCLSSCLHPLCTFPLTSNNCFFRFIILTPASCFWVLTFK